MFVYISKYKTVGNEKKYINKNVIICLCNKNVEHTQNLVHERE